MCWSYADSYQFHIYIFHIPHIMYCAYFLKLVFKECSVRIYNFIQQLQSKNILHILQTISKVNNDVSCALVGRKSWKGKIDFLQNSNLAHQPPDPFHNDDSNFEKTICVQTKEINHRLFIIMMTQINFTKNVIMKETKIRTYFDLVIMNMMFELHLVVWMN